LDTVTKIIKLYFPDNQEVEQYLDLSLDRPGQDLRYALNDDKLRALGWEPKAVFDKELPFIIDYYKNNFIW
jgi:dTDP-D-glucose 4,6-dehydratase